MASIQKRGVKWVAEIRTKGKYKSKTFLNKADARIWAEEQERIAGRRTGLVLGKTFGQAMQRYAEEIAPTKKGERWEVIRLTKLQRDDIAAIPIADISPQDIQDWIGRQTIKGSSINRELNLLSAVLTVSVKRWKWLERNPMPDIERPKDSPPRDRIISPDELLRICLALGYDGVVHTQRQKIAVAALIADETAMRQGEIFGIHAEHINWQERYVLLQDTKNGDARKVPLSAKAEGLFKSLNVEEGKLFPFSQASAATIFRRAVDMAGIKGVRFHDLRHSGITRLAEKLDPLALARFVGHKDLRNLLIYYNPKPKDIAEKLD